jgi:hypothetical protein
MKFALADKDFDSVKADVPKSEKCFEILRTEKDEYTLFLHYGDNVEGIYEFNLDELKTLWKMMTTK